MSGVTFELQRTVTKSSLPMDIKCMLLVMILHADIDTAEGYSSQGKIAELMSCSRRKVIYAMQELERLVEARKSPVRIVRTRRGKKGGTGRDSDLYRIEAIPESARCAPSAETQSADCAHSDTPKVQAVHIEPPDSQSSKCKSETSKCKTGDLKVQTSAHDLPCDPPSIDPPCLFPSSEPTVTQPSPKTRKAPKNTQSRTKASKPEHPEHKRVVDHYFESFEKRRGAKPPFDGAEGTAVKRLLKKLNGDAQLACEVITNAFTHPFFGADCTILQIARDPARFRTPRAVHPTMRKLVERQQGSNAEVKANDAKWSKKTTAPVIPIAREASS